MRFSVATARYTGLNRQLRESCKVNQPKGLHEASNDSLLKLNGFTTVTFCTTVTRTPYSRRGLSARLTATRRLRVSRRCCFRRLRRPENREMVRCVSPAPQPSQFYI